MSSPPPVSPNAGSGASATSSPRSGGGNWPAASSVLISDPCELVDVVEPRLAVVLVPAVLVRRRLDVVRALPQLLLGVDRPLEVVGVQLVPPSAAPGEAALLDEDVARRPLTVVHEVVGVRVLLHRRLEHVGVVGAVPGLRRRVGSELAAADPPTELVPHRPNGALHRIGGHVDGDAPAVVGGARLRGERTLARDVQVPEMLLV